MLTASKSPVCRFTIRVEASRFRSFERSSSWQLKGCEETFKPATILQPRHRNPESDTIRPNAKMVQRFRWLS